MFVLIHSPLLSPLVWEPLAALLQEAGHSVCVPALDNNKGGSERFDTHHRQLISEQLPEQLAEPLIAVAHSGAGPLVAVLAGAIPVAGSIFLDAIFPVNGKSRFDLFDPPQDADLFRQAAAHNRGLLPAWTEDVLAPFVEDAATRQRLAQSLSDTPVDIYEEILDVPEGWPDAPGLYVRWTGAYRLDAARAQTAGLRMAHQPAGHLHMLNAPEAVAPLLLDVAAAVAAGG